MRDTRIRTITKLLFPNRDVHMFISVFHFSFFCGISTFVSYNYIKLTKSFVKVKYFFYFLLKYFFNVFNLSSASDNIDNASSAFL
jgi:hypothetical protein